MQRLLITLVVIGVYTAVELVAALLTGSLALLADAGHMLTDSAALLVSLLALWVAKRPPTRTLTFGYRRVEVLAAAANAASLLVIAVYIVVEAYRRWQSPPALAGATVSLVALGGLAVNLVALLLRHGTRRESLNLRGAFLHVIGDLLGSLGALGAGLAIWMYGWYWADPALSVLIGALVLFSGARLLRDASRVLLEGAPPEIRVEEVQRALTELPGVAAVHDLHVWTIGSGMVSVTAHVVAESPRAEEEILCRVHALLRARFALQHATVQVETPEHTASWECGAHGCQGAPEH